MQTFENIYKDKTVLITGHTGFKGSWLCIWLKMLGAKVVGYSLDPYGENDNFVLSNISESIVDIRGDIRDIAKLEGVFEKYKPEFVFHLAAQPLVKFSYEQPVLTYETNVMGTINVLEAIRKQDCVKVAIMVTTDKCYDNKEQIYGYRETDSLGGYDPYSSSKGAAEIAINSWRLSYFNPDEFDKHGTALASVRAGNVIGGGDWAKDRIIPDCIRAIENDKTIEIRSPRAVRPWEYVLEPISGYLLLGLNMYKSPREYASAWNFGPENNSIVPVWDVANLVIKYYKKGTLKDISNKNALHEANLLSLDISKARHYLNWVPTYSINEAIEKTVEWYRLYKECNVLELCQKQILEFTDKQNPRD